MPKKSTLYILKSVKISKRVIQNDLIYGLRQYHSGGTLDSCPEVKCSGLATTAKIGERRRKQFKMLSDISDF
jgi:hypothetical protein